MSSEKRTYKLKAREKSQQETRNRIVEATAALHQEVGPARTTVAEIARRAGVQRLTVYTHFPDDLGLIEACQSHFYTLHPPPDLGSVLSRNTPENSVREILLLLYTWYAETEQGVAPVLQDRYAVPSLDQVVTRVVDAPQDELALHMSAAFSLTQQSELHLRALIRLALDFWTWHRLKTSDLSADEAASLMSSVITAFALRPNPPVE